MTFLPAVRESGALVLDRGFDDAARVTLDVGEGVVG